MLRLTHRERSRHFAGILRLVAAISVVMSLAPHGAAAGYRLKVLHRFCPRGTTICTDGIQPIAGLIMDRAGNLYGTTQTGGVPHPYCALNPYGCGAIFELTPDAAYASGWAEAVLHRFCSGGEPCPDGDAPEAGLIIDGAGNLYGTTWMGGDSGRGVVFELTPNASRTAWKETVLHSFCAQTNCDDGSAPLAGLIMDAAGNLYGTTVQGGGTQSDAGVVFELTPHGSRTSWTETVLYSFCAQANCVDGAGPAAGLIMDGAGNLYGTAQNGGAASGRGVVFELTPNASRTSWTETVLYSFCAQANCADGAEPFAGVTMDAAGNLYGTTFKGGASDMGAVFELTPNASRTSWTETVLHSFCAQTSCDDGALPSASLIVDAAGNLYGTTDYGDPTSSTQYGPGVVFELTPNAAGTPWTETVLHRFCSRGTPCPDGSVSGAGLITDGAGNLYGTTIGGGVNNGGVVFEVVTSPGASAARMAKPPVRGGVN
jgi:uncharacterized repeat protein (TIGR03803 family)